MIRLPDHVDLGHDTTRIKDRRDAERQARTVATLLDRFFNNDVEHRKAMQIVADEVGMGKTFVALATAYSVLQFMYDKGHPGDLRGCVEKVVIVTPQNKALHRKWVREVSEFVRRCVVGPKRDSAMRRFSPQQIDRPDKLVQALCEKGGSRVLVTHTGALGANFTDYNLKRQSLLAALFRFWGNRLRIDVRNRLLKGAPDNWPRDASMLELFDNETRDQLCFSVDTLIEGIRAYDAEIRDGESLIDQALELAHSIGQPYQRRRDVLFAELEKLLNKLYRELLGYLVGRSIPLVVVDEAHNWKNGPTRGTNNYRHFEALLGKHSRRLLMLTATPFQLHPREMLELLRIGEMLSPSTTQSDNHRRRSEMERFRLKVIKPALDTAARESQHFSRAWRRLPKGVSTEALESVWQSDEMSVLRTMLYAEAALPGVVGTGAIDRLIDSNTAGLDPKIREFVRHALRLYTINADLSKELGQLVIRHRRDTRHRLFRIGEEAKANYQISCIVTRPDAHVLHSADGVDVRGEGELPHYLLMRCVSEMKQGKGRSSLGSALTGCYSTLLYSAEGKQIDRALESSPLGRVYLDLLKDLVNEEQDHAHPKVVTAVEAILQAWRRGDKTLVFCFRTNTAKRIRDIAHQEIERELGKRRQKCLGGESALKTLRSRLTARDRDLIGLGLDRVLWSLLWATRGNGEPSISPDMFRLTDEALYDLAYLGLKYGQDLTADRVDRVFLHRCTEHLIARNIPLSRLASRKARWLLERMRDESWVQRPYGIAHRDSDDDGGEEQADYDERGVHTTYELISQSPGRAAIEAVAEELRQRRWRAQRTRQVSIIDGYSNLPSLWLGVDPLDEYNKEGSKLARLLEKMHSESWELSFDDGGAALDQRLYAMQSLRRTLLRESVLLRLLPEKADLEESSWGQLLVTAFQDPMPGQPESMADRIAVFLEDLRASSGKIGQQGTARHALWDSTRLREQQYVALVSGDTANDTRDRIFNGFNTPLLPEVLVCTSVGQEGIDLHRHCRQVIHYDLAWNPATLEQRTGRADRIGSKTSRERKLGQQEHGPYLEVNVPFLAGTYDERMFEELRLRSQTFEVLTGGDLAVDYDRSSPQNADEEGAEHELRLVALPDSIINDLRVNLAVWRDEAAETTHR